MADLSKVCKREELEAQREPHWHPQLREGAHLGFRPSKKKGRLGTWIARARDRDSGKYKFRSLGEYADLSAKDRFAAAKADAEIFAVEIETGGLRPAEIVTVGDACREYEAKGNDRATLNRLVMNDDIASIKLDKLRRRHLLDWRKRLTGKPSTINRAMVPLRAALGAVKEPGRPGTDAAWQEALKPAPKSEVQPEERKRIYLTPGERRVLAKLASFVEALTLLPLRPGALAALRVKDFDRRTGVLTIPKDKAGAGRIIPLSGSTRQFIEAQCKGKAVEAWLFTLPDGRQWERHDWADLLRERGVEAYDIRHAVLTDLADAGVPPNALAKLAGTSVAMLEATYYKLTEQTAAEALAKLAG